MPCPAPTPLHVLQWPQPQWLCAHRFRAAFTFPSAPQPTWGFEEARVVLPEARGSLGSWPHVPTLMGAAVVFSLDGASSWVLANLSPLLEVSRCQNLMERKCDPMQTPWLLRAHLWKGEFLFSVEERRFQ